MSKLELADPNDETPDHADLSMQLARTVSDITSAAVLQIRLLDSLIARVARLELLEKRITTLENSVEVLQKEPKTFSTASSQLRLSFGRFFSVSLTYPALRVGVGSPDPDLRR